MTRLSLSDIVEAQAAQVETLLGMVRDLTALQAQTLAAFAESRKQTAAERVTLSRSKLADKATGVDVEVVPQEGESLTAAALRAAETFEGLAGRYPLPNGTAHAAGLGDGLDAWRETLDAGLHAVPDPEPTA
jgi:hypothetical protein